MPTQTDLKIIAITVQVLFMSYVILIAHGRGPAVSCVLFRTPMQTRPRIAEGFTMRCTRFATMILQGISKTATRQPAK
jgi:hypothetical protein